MQAVTLLWQDIAQSYTKQSKVRVIFLSIYTIYLAYMKSCWFFTTHTA